MKVVSVPVRQRPQRTAADRAFMLAPGLLRLLARQLLRLAPGNPLRTAVLRDVIARSYAAMARGDLDLPARLYFHRDSVLRFADDPGPDFVERYEGRAASFAAYRRWMEHWGELRREPVGLVDRGDAVVVLGREHVRGAGSGLEMEREFGQVFRLRGPVVIEYTEFRSWEGALAIGADEAPTGDPDRRERGQ